MQTSRRWKTFEETPLRCNSRRTDICFMYNLNRGRFCRRERLLVFLECHIYFHRFLRTTAFTKWSDPNVSLFLLYQFQSQGPNCEEPVAFSPATRPSNPLKWRFQQAVCVWERERGERWEERERELMYIKRASSRPRRSFLSLSHAHVA